MAQSGVPVPADRADLPLFDAVLADIGDYQSIEQNLSTFSAHVTNIDFISRTATAASLVLLDELGSATDPEEGAALAVAIADHFRRLGCTSIISTHHTSLKVYGANTAGVINASVGFDEATLQPTYELKIGVPGASAGINIAQRLGLNPSIIDSARTRLGSQARDVGEFLDRLHADLREAEAERRRLKAKEDELEREKARLASEGRIEQQAKIKEMERKLDTLLRDFEYHAREAVNAVQDRAAKQKISKEAERRISKLRREFRDQFDSSVVAHTTGADIGDANAQPQMVKYVSEGDTVKLKSVGRPAKISRKIDDNHFEVEIGVMKMKIAARRYRRSPHPRRRHSHPGCPCPRHLGVARIRNPGRPQRNQRHRTYRRRRHRRSPKIRRPRLPGRTPPRPRSSRQRYGHPAQSPAPIPAKASTR